MLTEGRTAGTASPETLENTTQESGLEQSEAPTLDHKVIRRNGKTTSFDASKIKIALTKAFLAVEGNKAAASERIHEKVDDLTEQVVDNLFRRAPLNSTVHIEDIQDQVELALMRAAEHKVAREYVLYRERQSIKRSEDKANQTEVAAVETTTAIQVKMEDGTSTDLDTKRLETLVRESTSKLKDVDPESIIKATMRNLFDGIPEEDVSKALVMSARALIETDPNYSFVAARLLLDNLRHDALSFVYQQPMISTQGEMYNHYPEYFEAYIHRAAELELLDNQLTHYDLKKLGAAIKPERDQQFNYLGLQTLHDRYFIHFEETRFELPQAFFMRVAMGLAINEVKREERTIEFYNLLSSFDFMSSTPTLFNSGTLRPQLSSCYLTTVPDDLDGIFNSIKDDAMLSKYAGGLGNDWSRVRGIGAHIKGTNGKSQGVVPFLKVANDTAVAVNQCFAADTLLYTADGTKAIKDINTGDLVLGKRGEYREVKQKMAYNQTDPMVEIEAKHSTTPLKVTSGHPLYALQDVPMEQANARTMKWLQNGKVKPAWVDAGKLQKGDYVAQVIPKETIPVAEFTPDDARLYGILLGDGHCSKSGLEWGVSGNPEKDIHLDFVQNYLDAHGIHYWIKNQREKYMQIGWSAGFGVARDGTTGQLIRGNKPGFLFSREELYDTAGKKRIARQYTHLPKDQTLALIHGLLETDGGVSRGKEIYFTNTSQPLIDGMRYQLLRLGVPCAGQYRERKHNHTANRANGEEITFNNITKAYDLRIPAIKDIAKPLGCKPLTKYNWIEWKGMIFSRLRKVQNIKPTPFVYDLKIEGDPSYMTTSGLAHNGGKRKGAMCAYLETWHIDIEEFMDLRKNTGDERRRTHDMNTANWIPDLFMERVSEDKSWTLFSPDETPELHELYGKAFKKKYEEYEAKAAQGELNIHKKIKAVDLWRKMLGMLFETGHPWITFKDPCNLRSPQQHSGVVHSSNLCTEITLNTNDNEIAVCNLGSVNLPQHIGENGLDIEKLEKTITTAMRMLDNVIDYNYYAVPQARNSNMKHRPVGLGIMGFQDALYKMDYAYASEKAVNFADTSMEAVSYFAIRASSDLAAERGTYPSYKNSLWDQGIMPLDSIELLEAHRGDYIQVDKSSTLDWDSLRSTVKKQGMRNSNTMAIAPTATISNICGVSQSIEPTYQNLFVKSNLSGEFTVVNSYMVKELKDSKLWDDVMINDLKYYDGSLQPINRIPQTIKDKYASAFEIDARWLIEAAARRQKWIDQGQSLNIYMAEPSGKKLDNIYKLAWVRGLKTTYYLRSIGATHVEKTSTTQIEHDDLDKLIAKTKTNAPKACSILEPDCDACQ